MSKHTAIVISDLHFTPATLEIATECLKKAITFANSLNVPLIIAGDTLDSKSIIRAECANRLIEILGTRAVGRTKILVGNHDLLNEKGKEHSLRFLEPYAEIIQTPVYDIKLDLWLIPYMSSNQELAELLAKIPKGSRIVMHQGVQTAYMGHYVQDKSSLPKEAFDGLIAISGHYHRAQDILCGATGRVTYVGNPYTLSFSEASDGEKFFMILYDDGTYFRVPTYQRKHVIKEMSIVELTMANGADMLEYEYDLLWLKVHGTKSELIKLNKKELGQRLFGHSNFKLDLIPSDNHKVLKNNANLQDQEILDQLIDNMPETIEQKSNLKTMWKDLINETA